MNHQQTNNPLHGKTLETVVSSLVEHFGWDELGDRINIRCFKNDPSIKSSLKLLRKAQWARKMAEDLYIVIQKNNLKVTEALLFNPSVTFFNLFYPIIQLRC